MTEELLAEWATFVCLHLGTVRPGEYRIRKLREISPFMADLIKRNPNLDQSGLFDLLNFLADEDYIAARESDCDTKWTGKPVTSFVETMELMGPMLASSAGGRLLDVGCAHAAYSIFLSRHGFFDQVVGLDASPGTLRMARRIAESESVEIELVEGFADQMSFTDDSFDSVICNQLLHQSKRWEQIVAEIARVLAPFGCAFFTCFTCGPRGPKRLSDLMARLVDCQLVPICAVASSMGLDHAVVAIQAMKAPVPIEVDIDPGMNNVVCMACPARPHTTNA